MESLRAESDRIQKLYARSPAHQGAAEKILQAALDGKPGWRDAARIHLGAYRLIECEYCGKTFRSGGKRKKYCSIACYKAVR